MTERENCLRAYRFQHPGRIPTTMRFSASCWNHYDPELLRSLIDSHPLLFPSGLDPVDEQIEPWRRAGVEYVDSWGCVWKTDQDGITGSVIFHPLEEWDPLESYRVPDPRKHNGWGEVSWEKVSRQLERQRQNEQLVRHDLRHGFFFLTLEYLRGYENLMYDMADAEPRLNYLSRKVENFNAEIVKRLLTMNPDMIGFPEDLGAQQGPLISPRLFRRYLLPTYRRLMKPVRHQGVLVHMHSDGHVLALIDDLIACGVDVLNIQDLVNGVKEIAETCSGRVAVELDIDRQQVTPGGNPRDIEDLIREEVERLGSPEGGLALFYELYPGVPVENIRAVMDAMERNSDVMRSP